jgi:hypothetical protein
MIDYLSIYGMFNKFTFQMKLFEYFFLRVKIRVPNLSYEFRLLIIN